MTHKFSCLITQKTSMAFYADIYLHWTTNSLVVKWSVARFKNNKLEFLKTTLCWGAKTNIWHKHRKLEPRILPLSSRSHQRGAGTCTCFIHIFTNHMLLRSGSFYDNEPPVFFAYLSPVKADTCYLMPWHLLPISRNAVLMLSDYLFDKFVSFMQISLQCRRLLPMLELNDD